MRISFASVRLFLVTLLVFSVAGCAPEVGSPDWCKAIKAKSSGDLTMNEAKDYAKHCVFK